MKKIKNIFIKALLSSLILALCVGMTIGAENEGTWINVYTKDFETPIESSVLNSYIKNEAPYYRFDVATKGGLGYEGKLSVESDSIVHQTFKDISSKTVINGEKNSHGITMLFTSNAIKSFAPRNVGGYNVELKGDGGDTSTGFFTHVGKNATMIGTYYCDGSGLRTNTGFFLVDQELYSADKNNFAIEIDYYLTEPEIEGVAKGVNLNYMTTSGGMAGKSIPADKLVTGKWSTYSLDVNNADFSKAALRNNIPYNISFSLSGAPYTYNNDAFFNDYLTNNGKTWFEANKKDPSLKLYISSVRIINKNETAQKFEANKKAMYLPFDEDFLGNAKLTFDMMIPTGLSSDRGEYNSEAGAVRVGIADADGEDVVDIATVEVENTGSGTIIYAIHENDSGAETKTVIYDEDIIDLDLTYTFELDWREKTYTVKITDGGEELSLEEVGPFKINGYSQYEENETCTAKYLVARHSNTGNETLSLIDNVSLDVMEDPAFANMQEDIENAVSGSQIKSGIVTENIPLPQTGTLNNSVFSWESSDPEVLEISDDGTMAIAHRGEEDKEVTLTVEAELGELYHTQEFVLTVKEHEDHKRVVEAKDAFRVELPEVTETGFMLPVGVDGFVDAEVTWDDPSGIMQIDETGEVTLKRPDEDTDVTLTANIKIGDFAETKSFGPIKVVGLSKVKSEIGDIVETDTPDGKINATVTVKTPVYGELTFAAVAVDSNGVIHNQDSHTINVVERSGDITFSITNFEQPEGTKIKYYLWDANGVPLKNTKPTDITINTSGKYTGIRIDWTPSKDDSGAIKHYEIYRDNGEEPIYIASGDKTSYLDKEAVRDVTYAYRVVPVDPNYVESTSNTSSAYTDVDMYYYDFKNGKSKGLSIGKADPSSTFITGAVAEVDPKNTGYLTNCATIPIDERVGHRRGFFGIWVDLGKVTDYDGKITITIDYFDTEDPLELFYNQVIPEGEADGHKYASHSIVVPDTGKGLNDWNTATVYLEDASFRDQTHSHAHFGLRGKHPTDGNKAAQCYIRKVELLPTNLYK